MKRYHTPVLLEESIAAMALRDGGVYADVTYGGGGHSKRVLSLMGKNSHLISMDRDREALENASKDKRLIVVHNNFRFLSNYVEYHGFNKLDAILADLGVSSHQFDTDRRGFSFRFDAPLDMRMNQFGEVTAEMVVNRYSKERLTELFRTYGEVRESRRLAQLISDDRERAPITTTFQLNRVAAPLLNPRFENKELAKIYQALRVEVNGEMDALILFLESCKKLLKVGGRLVVITYHSLEDRVVKNFMRSGSPTGKVERDFYGNYNTPFKVITRKPILPTEREVEENSRARSAKLRVAEKV